MPYIHGKYRRSTTTLPSPATRSPAQATRSGARTTRSPACGGAPSTCSTPGEARGLSAACAKGSCTDLRSLVSVVGASRRFSGWLLPSLCRRHAMTGSAHPPLSPCTTHPAPLVSCAALARTSTMTISGRFWRRWWNRPGCAHERAAAETTACCQQTCPLHYGSGECLLVPLNSHTAPHLSLIHI